MINLGLTTAQLNQFHSILASHHEIQVSVQLLDLSHNYLSDLSKRMLSGQVDMDATAEEASRSCSMEILDPFHDLKLDGNSPADGSIYYNRMIKVIYSVIGIGGSPRFDVPVFCGPLSKVERDGVVLKVSAIGKEKLSMALVWRAHIYFANQQKSTVIRNILRDQGGEQKIDVQTTLGWLPNNLAIDREKKPWTSAKQLAGTVNMDLFYDGRGTARGRLRSNRAVYTFDEKVLLSPVSTSFDTENAVNCVSVTGGKPKKAFFQVAWTATAPYSHPLSPSKIGRFGKQRYLPEFIDDSSIMDVAEAKRIADNTLATKMIEQVEVSFDCLPIPHLEENDVCILTTRDFTGPFKLTSFSLPLTADGEMTVGYTRRLWGSAVRRKARRNRNRNRTKPYKDRAEKFTGVKGDRWEKFEGKKSRKKKSPKRGKKGRK